MDEKEKKPDLWLPIFMSLLTSMNQPIELEKEVAYLKGKIDTLEKIVISKNDSK